MPTAIVTGSTVLQRMQMRAALRRMYSSAAPSDQANITAILANAAAFEELTATAAQQHEQETAGGDAAGGGAVSNFLQWLLANQSAVLAFIQSIIALFQPPTT